MTTKHQHKFSRSKPDATVETCTCGKFRHTEHNHNPIIEAQPPAAPAQVEPPTLQEKAEAQGAVWSDSLDGYIIADTDINRLVAERDQARAEAENYKAERDGARTVLADERHDLKQARAQVADWQKLLTDTEAKLEQEQSKASENAARLLNQIADLLIYMRHIVSIANNPDKGSNGIRLDIIESEARAAIARAEQQPRSTRKGGQP